jgi:ADP-ribose pyrophosphatase YjhB (NUDIX family)
MTPNSFTIRVYGLLIHEEQLLLSRENVYGKIYNKLPGGGLEFGEGVVDCVKREFMEEAQIQIHKTEHFYTTEKYYVSAFDATKQVLSLYYKVWTDELQLIKTGNPNDELTLVNHSDQILYWCSIQKLLGEPMPFPIDKIVIQKLVNEHHS